MTGDNRAADENGFYRNASHTGTVLSFAVEAFKQG